MRLLTFLLLCLLLFSACPVFAFSDIGLLKNQKTIGLFLLSPSNSSDMSTGAVYHQKKNDKLALEISCVNYYMVYPFMKNVLKLRADGQYKWLQLGPATITAIAGPTIYFASSVGASLAVDVGGIIYLNILDNLAASLAFDATIFKDGIGCDVEPMISFVPPFLKNTEIFGGMRMEASMVGFSTDGISHGKINYYLDAGLRIGL
jgi:hypothetical protein